MENKNKPIRTEEPIMDPEFDSDDGFIDVHIDNNDGHEDVDGHLPQQQLQLNEKGTEQLTDQDESNIEQNKLISEQQTSEQAEEEDQFEMEPLLLDNTNEEQLPLAAPDTNSIPTTPRIRSRKKNGSGSIPEYEDEEDYTKRSCLRKKVGDTNDPIDEYSDNESPPVSGGPGAAINNAVGCGRVKRFCNSHHLIRTTRTVISFTSRLLLWTSILAMVVGVVWYSRELKMNGTDPHLIAWFSAGAFVLLGFPISMCGIFMHLTNYYQPNVQCYVVRILWMVPIYSVESWLCLRFHNAAIYIETLRDFYESYVLYSFLQFLIEVLGGEEALIMMLKDKSPTRGVHMWGMNCFLKPWLMGQPVSRRDSYTPDKRKGASNAALLESEHGSHGISSRPVKRIQWTSPFFTKCKVGVLQYVLLKFVSAIFVMILEIYGLYKEGDFTPRGGYLYICIITNLSQCWALYCLVFFYYATKNELGPIRPVGKFMSVKAVVFFTWWQSLGISMLFQMGLIPHYAAVDDGREWTAEAVAKGLQDYLICIEMFVAAIVHTFVFPHTDYLEPLHMNPRGHHITTSRRLGRRGRFAHHRRGDDKSACSKSSGGLEPNESLAHDVELGSVDSGNLSHARRTNDFNSERCATVEESDHESTASSGGLASPRRQRQGFVRALLDSTVPRDVFGETVGMVKGEFHVEKKTLLHHAATSDEYDLFSSKRRRIFVKKGKLKSSTTQSQIPDTITM